MKTTTLAGVVLVSLAGPMAPLPAQDATVRAYVDRTTIGLNQTFTLSLEINGASGRLETDPVLPDMGAFTAFLGSGSSQQIQIVNGRTTVSFTIQYRFQATAEGQHEIGPVAVTIAGRRFVTDAIAIEVTSSGAAPSGPAPGARPPDPSRRAPSDVEIAPDDLFLRATVNKRTVYENEPVVVEYEIFTRVRVASYSVTKAPGTAGFWAEDFPLPSSPEIRSEVLDGRQYTVATLKKTALFPTGAGRRTIEPMAIETAVRVQRRTGDPFEDFFRRGALFNETVPHVIVSDSLTIDVLPLPTTNRPPGFTGVVGDLRITAAADKTNAETNEAITLRVAVEGIGNLRSLTEPTIAFPPDFEVFPPDVDQTVDRTGDRIGGRKAYEYVLVPRAPGQKTIEPIRLAYFDPRRGAYATVATDPITIEVTGDPVAGAAAAGAGRGAIRTVREDIRFIETNVPAFRPVNRRFFDGSGFWLTALLPLFAVGGAAAVRRHRDRLRGDVAYARNRRAGRVARKRLALARQAATGERAKEFYAEVGRALTGFAADKLNVAETGIVRDELLHHLLDRGVPETVAQEYLACLDVCDLKRFSPAAAAPDEMQEFLTRVEAAMTGLDQGFDR